MFVIMFATMSPIMFCHIVRGRAALARRGGAARGGAPPGAPMDSAWGQPVKHELEKYVINVTYGRAGMRVVFKASSASVARIFTPPSHATPWTAALSPLATAAWVVDSSAVLGH